jgi:hypothetical protein
MLAADVPERWRFSGAVPNVQDLYRVVENLEIDLVGVMLLAVQNSSDLNLWTPSRKFNCDRRATGILPQRTDRFSETLEPLRPPHRSVL